MKIIQKTPKLCECGCGELAPLAKRTQQGTLRGTPLRFVVGHNGRGRRYTDRSKVPNEIRFWAKVEKTDTCWLWTGCVNLNGYGDFKASDRNTRAHRFSWQIHRGVIPPGMFVCHTCDVPACVNPDHLFLGTPQDNVTDKIAKGRTKTPNGEGVGSAKLTAAKVIQIRSLCKQKGITIAEIARRFGVAFPTVAKIVRYQAWRHIP